MVKFFIKLVTINDYYVVVDYEIVLLKDNFEGAIGGGRTELPVAPFEAAIDNLKMELEAYIEKTVGIAPIDNKPTGPKEEEDPL